MRNLICALALALACATPGRAAHFKLHLLIWSEYLDPKIVEEFEQLYDCKVTQEYFEEEDAMLAKVKAAGPGQYDVIFPPDHCVPGLLKLKLLAPLRHEDMPNLKNLEDRFLNPPWDPGNRFTAAYQWGTTGIYVRKPKDKPLEETWGLLFDPKLQPGPFLLMDSMRDLMSAALIYKGFNPNSTDAKELKQVRDLLLQTKKRAFGLEGGVGGKNKVLAKTVVAAMAYNGDAARGMKDDRETCFILPKEGAQMWVDNMAIVVGAPNRFVAQKFINFILRPEIGARLSDFNKYATPNKAALPLISRDDFRNPAIYPPPELVKKLQFTQDLGRKLRLYDEIWTQIKAK